MLSVGSWNVLAASYAGAHLYPYCDPLDLETMGRYEKIVAWIRGAGVDVMALQEVEPALVEVLEGAFGIGRVLWCPKYEGRADGSAVVLADGVIELGHEVEWLSNSIFRSGHVLQIVSVSKDNKEYKIGNAHIKYSPSTTRSGDDESLFQMKIALSALEGDGATILAGDLNYEPGDRVRRALVGAGYREYQSPGPSAYVNGNAKSIDVISGRGVVGTARAHAVPVEQVLPNKHWPSDHTALVVDFE